MTGTPHAYFAYGSNLDVAQMARRCPDAHSPRPARLLDHDWLINCRGVATVEPATGDGTHRPTVFGVLWRLGDGDLDALDSAEGVPVRYRRERCVVETADGPHPAWVYVDPRTDPGSPRPGYLERVVAGAEHHGLPRRWIDQLHRWDPSTWPPPRRSDGSGPQTLTALLAHPGVEEHAVLRSTVGLMAIHGGGLERMTDVIAERVADAAQASLYVVRHPPDHPHHLPSARYAPAESAALDGFLSHVEVVVSLHGYGRLGRGTDILAGGRNRDVAREVAAHLDVPGHRVVTDLDAIPRELRGLHPDNPVNLPRRGGVQLELPALVRGISPRSPLPVCDDGLSPSTEALVRGLVAACRHRGPRSD